MTDPEPDVSPCAVPTPDPVPGLDPLEASRVRPRGTSLTTDQGVRIVTTDDSLKAGLRGRARLEDLHLRGKPTRFDHEWSVAADVGVAPPHRGDAAAAAVGGAPSLSVRPDADAAIVSRRVAVLVEGGVRAAAVQAIAHALDAERTSLELVSGALGSVESDRGPLEVAKTFATAASVAYDGVVVPGGAASVAALRARPAAVRFLEEAYRHGKPIALAEAAAPLLADALRWATTPHAGDPRRRGVVVGPDGDEAGMSAAFVRVLRLHRHFEREARGMGY